MTHTPEEAASGFVYVGDDEQGPMSAAAPGARIGDRVDRRPWIVVDHHPCSVTLATWPGRLWRVRIIHKASEQPAAYAGYTRATAVDVLDEAPLSELFGAGGEAVVDLLRSIAHLPLAVIDALSLSNDEQAARCCNAVWDRWLADVDPDSPFLGDDHAGILAMGPTVPRSPVGAAPSVLHAELRKRALALVGGAAFVVDDEEEGFNAAWSRAAASLQHALFALGADARYVSAAEREQLQCAWQAAAATG